MKRYLRQTFPQIWHRARLARKSITLTRRLFGNYPRTCTICNYNGKFLAEIHFPDIFNYDAICPKCGSMSRNRLLILKTIEHKLLSPEDKLLHFAPEHSVTRVVKPMVAHYTTTDLDPRGVDRQENIEALSFGEGEWDVVICSHVLEHVDHRKALAELFRVLRPSGRLLALFPIVEGWSNNYENVAVSSSYDRGIHFGKDNHQRRFGREVRDDFAAAGFQLENLSATGEEAVRYGLIPGEVLFVGRKPS